MTGTVVYRVHTNHRLAVGFLHLVRFFTPVVVPVIGQDRYLDWAARVTVRLLRVRAEEVR